MAEPQSSTHYAVTLMTDIVGSSSLKTKLGDKHYAALLERHYALLKRLIEDAGGQQVNWLGDGVLAEFSSAVAAVGVALAFQDAMHESKGEGQKLRARVGINAGEVTVIRVGQRTDIVATSVDLTERVMSLAGGGQILMTKAVYEAARPFDWENLHADRARATNVPRQLWWILRGNQRLKKSNLRAAIVEVRDRRAQWRVTRSMLTPRGRIWKAAAAIAVGLSLTGLIGPALDGRFEWSRFQLAWQIVNLPRFGVYDDLSQVGLLELCKADDVQAFCAAAGYGQVDPTNRASYRAVHIGLLRKLAAAEPSGVAIDMQFVGEAQHDQELADAIRELKCPVVLVRSAYAGTTGAELGLPSAFAEFPSGQASFGKTEPQNLWYYDLAVQQKTRILEPSIALQLVALVEEAEAKKSRAPTPTRPSTPTRPTTGSVSGETLSATTAPGIGLSTTNMMSMQTDPPAFQMGRHWYEGSMISSPRDDMMEMGVSPDATVLERFIVLPASDEVKAATRTYTDVLTADDGAAFFRGKLVLIASTRTDGKNPEKPTPYVDGSLRYPLEANLAMLADLNKHPPIRTSISIHYAGWDTFVAIAASLISAGTVTWVALGRSRWHFRVAVMLGSMAAVSVVVGLMWMSYGNFIFWLPPLLLTFAAGITAQLLRPCDYDALKRCWIAHANRSSK